MNREMWLWNFSVLVLYFINLSDGYNVTENFNKLALPRLFLGIVRNYITNSENNISERCKSHLEEYCDALADKIKPWAWLMFDAGTKIPSGILSGNMVDLGEFDQCLNIEKKLSEDNTILGKYCLGTIPLLPPTIKSVNSDLQALETRMTSTSGGFAAMFATCLPDSCSTSDIQQLYSRISTKIEFSDILCQSKSTKPELTGGDIATISFLSVIFFIMLISTVYDSFLLYLNKRPLHSLLIAFSVLTNGKKLIATTNSTSQILCLHGIRVISMMWIILGHRYLGESLLPRRNSIETIQWMYDQKSMFVLGGSVAVDTFFVLSGLLVAYSFMSAMAKGFKFNIFLYYVHRYLRLTPLLAVVVLIHATILIHLGSGPLWVSLQQHNGCKEYWWSELLYVQNYVNPDNLCLGQTWYLSIDTQLFLLSPILLIPLKKWPIVGLLITAVCLFGSILASFLTAWFNELFGFMLANHGSKEYTHHFYNAVHIRAGPWLMGVLLGYYIYEIKQKHKKISINKVAALILWMISLTILCACVFTGHNTILLTYEYDRVANAFYAALLRPGWALGLCWVIFACVVGYGGPVNWFLSLPMFQVASKLTYSMYLIHIAIIHLVSDQRRASTVFSNLQTMHIFWGDFAFTFATCIIFTLAFESPIIIIEKVIFGKGKEKEATPNAPAEIQKKQEIP